MNCCRHKSICPSSGVRLQNQILPSCMTEQKYFNCHRHRHRPNNSDSIKSFTANQNRMILYLHPGNNSRKLPKKINSFIYFHRAFIDYIGVTFLFCDSLFVVGVVVDDDDDAFGFFHFSLSMYRCVCWCSRQPMDILSFVCHRLITESYPKQKIKRGSHKLPLPQSHTYTTQYACIDTHSYTLSTQFIALTRHHLKFGELFDLVFVLSHTAPLDGMIHAHPFHFDIWRA